MKLFEELGPKVSILNISKALFEAEIQIHLSHLQAVGKSYAVHIALLEFYESVGDLNDNLVEKYQGKYGILTGYKPMNIQDGVEPIKYLQSLLTLVETNRKGLKEGYLEQLVDNVIEQITQTLFKLINLK